jgi:multiple sugar transport system permease protein
MTVLWFYGAIVGVLVLAATLGARYERARRILLYGSLAFFTLFLLGSALDGLRYFRLFDDIAAASGSQNYHFTLFRTSIGTFPDNTRVPLWMTSELWSKPSLILITMWSSGASMLIFLAALKGVPQSLYEAAEVDGANRMQKFFQITLPMISPALFYNVVIGVIAALQTFESVYILQTTLNVDSLRSAAFFLFERTFREQSIGQGASLSWILAAIIVVLTVMQFRYSNWVHYEV